MARPVRRTPALALGLIALLLACGKDAPTPPQTVAKSLAFTSQPTEALDGVPFAVTPRVTALDAAGKPATIPTDITIEVTSARNAVALSGSLTATTRNGVASFTDLTPVGAGRGIALTARAPGLTAVTSPAFDVSLHFRQVSAGHTSACGLTYQNVTWCWGDNSLFRLGVGDDVPRSAPARVLTDLRFDTISSGGIQQCGRLASQDVLCWGGRHPTPTPVAGYKFTWVASGSGSCGVTTTGAFYCWNGPDGAAVITPTFNSNGQFRISADYGNVCGIDLQQRAYCWGGNDYGQLGFVGTPNVSSFTQPVGSLRLTNIATSSNFACGIQADGVVLCWGDNRYGELGAGTKVAFSATPLEVAGGHRFTSISVGNWHACALATDGEAWCWGGGAQGQVGDGTNGQPNVPVRVLPPRKFSSIDAGGYFSCGLGVDGFTYCWGNNNNGELADGTTTNRATAVRVVAPPL